MKKKYCQPMVTEIVFRAEEAVSVCMFNALGNKQKIEATPENDYKKNGDPWAHGEFVDLYPNPAADIHYWYYKPGPYTTYKITEWLVAKDDPNIS